MQNEKICTNVLESCSKKELGSRDDEVPLEGGKFKNESCGCDFELIFGLKVRN